MQNNYHKSLYVSALFFGIMIFAFAPISKTNAQAGDGSVPPASDSGSGSTAIPPETPPASSSVPPSETSSSTSGTGATIPPSSGAPRETPPIAQPIIEVESQNLVVPTIQTGIETESSQNSNGKLYGILAGVIVAVGGFVALMLNTKKKKGNKCENIKEKLEQKKTELAGVEGEFSLKEAALEKLKEKIEAKKDAIQETIAEKAKQKIKEKVLDEENVIGKGIALAEKGKERYNDLSEKYEQGKNILEALKAKRDGVSSEIKTLERAYAACMAGAKVESVVVGGGIKIDFSGEPSNHVVVFSHGFAVKKDDQGLFTDIAEALSGVETILFDYNEIDEKNNTLTVRPFSEQIKMLEKVLEDIRKSNPGAVIDLICHSQGTIVGAGVTFSGIRKTILVSPVFDLNFERTLKRLQAIPGGVINLQGISKYPRKDGSTTIVPARYWTERKVMTKPVDIYNVFAEKTELIVIKPNQDNILGEVDMNGLNPKIKVIALDGNHSFEGEARKELADVISKILL